MSMKISADYRDHIGAYPEKMKVRQERSEEAVREQSAENRSDAVAAPQDEYISSEKSGNKPSGLYRMGQDEKGNPKVLFDDPEKGKDVQAGEQTAGKTENCTGNTDRVDREIEKLKEEKKQIEQQIKAAAGDEEKTGELEKKLVQIENELRRKDNDAYRRQNSDYNMDSRYDR